MIYAVFLIKSTSSVIESRVERWCASVHTYFKWFLLFESVIKIPVAKTKRFKINSRSKYELYVYNLGEENPHYGKKLGNRLTKLFMLQ